jgi:hypothetical protein
MIGGLTAWRLLDQVVEPALFYHFDRTVHERRQERS